MYYCVLFSIFSNLLIFLIGCNFNSNSLFGVVGVGVGGGMVLVVFYHCFSILYFITGPVEVRILCLELVPHKLILKSLFLFYHVHVP